MKDSLDDKAGVKKYFREKAEEWDRLRQEFYDDSLQDRVIRLSEIKEGSIVVDVGCGTGFLLKGELKFVGDDGKVVGVDSSEEMLNIARSKIEGYDQAKVELKVGDAENLPLDTSYADVVTGNMVLHHCPNPSLAIREMVRILKSGGRLVLSDLEEHGEEWLRDEMADLWLGFNLEKIRDWFRDVGLKKVQVEMFKSKCCGTSLAGCRAEIGIFIAKGIK